jgi:hypothetical protein
VILDQGAEGACVGFGWTGEALASPIRVNLQRVKADVPRTPDSFARWVYRSAQEIDEWPGKDYEGTSVLAGAKVMNGVGLLKEYRWAFNIEEVTQAVCRRGPVVIGIPWYSGMYDAPAGILTPSGYLVGGHCLLVVGYRVGHFNGEDAFILQNSWGPDWGINGLAYIRKSDLANLLLDMGEACSPTMRSYGWGLRAKLEDILT